MHTCREMKGIAWQEHGCDWSREQAARAGKHKRLPGCHFWKFVNVVSINSSNFSIIAVLMGLIRLVIMIYELFNLILQMFILNPLTMDYDSCILESQRLTGLD